MQDNSTLDQIIIDLRAKGELTFIEAYAILAALDCTRKRLLDKFAAHNFTRRFGVKVYDKIQQSKQSDEVTTT